MKQDLITVFIFFTGAAFGSFFNALSWRIHFYFYSQQRKKAPLQTRLVHLAVKPSACPHCSQKIKPLYLVPVAGALISRLRCRHCNGSISLFYPLGELVMGLLALLLYTAPLAAQAGLPVFSTAPVNEPLTIAFFAKMTAILVTTGLLYTVAYIDYRHFSIDLPPLLGLFISWSAVIALSGQGFYEPFITAGGAFVFFLLIYVAAPDKLGWGDVLLAAPLGFIASHPWWMASFNGSFFIALAWGIYSWFAVKSERKRAAGGRMMKMKLPLGTFLATGHIVLILYRAAYGLN